ncbi:MAG: hypothetical protein FJ284_07415 [Planctomycetes bacterium]|nr:hypothetical protein [Planctomycetota bacterium]MBM4057943.1 hypothetical protein [Planctomycetota bacterium]
MTRRIVHVMGCWLTVAVGLSAAAEPPDAAAAARRLAAARPGSGQAVLAADADRLAAIPAADIPAVLVALREATPAGANWVKSGLDRAVDRLGAAVSADALAGLACDRDAPPRARSLAFGWLEARDPVRARGLLAGMLEESALDLRRAAVAQLLADGAAGDEAVQKAAHRQALAAARDVDQVESIAAWLSEHGEPTQVVEVLGFVRRWRVSGEYDNAGGVGFAKVHPPEESVSPDTTGWQEVSSRDKHGQIDLNAALAAKKGVMAYALADVEMPRAGPAEVRIGSPCAVVVWVNGRRVMEHEIYHASEAIDQYVAAAEFRAGRNTVLVKCCQNEQTEPWAADWKFQVRITDPLGRPLASQREEP